MKLVIAYSLIVAMAIALLTHFVLIGIYGKILIQEPIVIILVLEIIFMVAIIAFGIYNLIKTIRDEKSI